MKNKKIKVIGKPLVYTKLVDASLHQEYFLHCSGIILNNSSEFFIDLNTAISDEENQKNGFVVPIVCQKSRILVLCHKCSYIFPDHRLSLQERKYYIENTSWIGPIPVQQTLSVSGDSDEIVLERRPYEELKRQLLVEQQRPEGKALMRIRNVIKRTLSTKPLSALRDEFFNFGRSYHAKHPDGVISRFLHTLIERLGNKEIEKIKQQLSQPEPETVETIKEKLNEMLDGKSDEEINGIISDPEFNTHLEKLTKLGKTSSSNVSTT